MTAHIFQHEDLAMIHGSDVPVRVCVPNYARHPAVLLVEVLRDGPVHRAGSSLWLFEHEIRRLTAAERAALAVTS